MATSTENRALEEQRSKDLALAKASTNTANRANDLTQAATLRTEIQNNAKANNAATVAAGTAVTAAASTAATVATNTTTADNSITSTLAGLGLSGMNSWATSTVSALVGKGIDPTTAVNTIISQMNAPQNADGSVNQDALNAFNTALPGFNQLIANTGQNGSPGASPAEAIAAYISYGAQVQAFASTLGLPANTITSTDIGNYWADQKSTTEISERLTDVNAAVQTMPQQVKDYLGTNFNMTPAQITAYYINPTNTINQINQMNNAAYVGGEAAITGFSSSMSLAQSQQLAAFLSNGSSSASSSDPGQVNALTAGDVNRAFTTQLNGNVQGSAAQLAAGGFTSTAPGQSTTGTVTQDQLLGAIENNAPDLAAVSQAQQARTAGARGGGGATTTATGALGLGFANS